MVYSLPDGLWLFSFGAALLLDRKKYYFHLFIYTLIYLGMILIEYIQKFYGGHGSKIGTFDVYDIMFFTLGYLGIFIISFYDFIKELRYSDKIDEIIFRKEIIEDIKIMLIFMILGVLPSLF